MEKSYSNYLNGSNGFREFEEIETVSLEEIEKFQKDMGIKLTNDYKDFIKQYNGFDLDYGFDNFLTNNLEDYIGLDSFLSLGFIKYKMSPTQFEDENYYYERMYKLEIFPFITNSTGHCEGYIGFGENNFGKIYVANTDLIGGESEKIIYICDSFTEFMNGFEKIPNCEV